MHSDYTKVIQKDEDKCFLFPDDMTFPIYCTVLKKKYGSRKLRFNL